jgi:hypothetical protein
MGTTSGGCRIRSASSESKKRDNFMLAYWMTWLRSALSEEAGQGLVEDA